MALYTRLRPRSKDDGETSVIASIHVLLTLPTVVLMLIASLDNADKKLMESSFPIFEKVLHWDVRELGYFSLATNLSYALSLPVWGWLIHRYNAIHSLQKLLAYACLVWGMACIAIAVVTLCSAAAASSSSSSSISTATFWTQLQISTRAINGMALGSILPLSQSLLVEYVPVKFQGQAFGMMGAGEKLAGTLSSAAVVYLGEAHWQYAYYTLGVLSICMGFLARYLSLLGSKNAATNIPKENEKNSDVLSLPQIVKRIIRMPAFMCLVAQGVFGGTPWDMMSYLLLLMDWRGFTSNQIVTVQFMQGIASMIGLWAGGMFGDFAASKNGSHGRISVALFSVVAGIPLYGLYLYSTSFPWALLWITLFNLVATFTPSAAIRPICADLTNGPSERAQIVALWIVLEKTSGALFGAPLVGYLTDRMLNDTNEQDAHENNVKARALAYNLFMLSSFFWGLCAFCWAIMLATIHNSTPTSKQKNSSSAGMATP